VIAPILEVLVRGKEGMAPAFLAPDGGKVAKFSQIPLNLQTGMEKYRRGRKELLC
jgi:hypothetical protein